MARKRYVRIKIGGEKGRWVTVPLESLDEEKVGPANHEPNASGKESLTPWPDAGDSSTATSSLRPTEDEAELDDWLNTPS